MIAPAVRAAVYVVFTIRWIVRWAVAAVLVMAGLLAALVAVSWVYYEEPWYDHGVIRQLASGPRTAPWDDVSDKAVQLFPDGMTALAATALLHANGFSCRSAAAESDDRPNRLSCRREPHILLCAGEYTVDLAFDRFEHVTDRKATFYIACV